MDGTMDAIQPATAGTPPDLTRTAFYAGTPSRPEVTEEAEGVFRVRVFSSQACQRLVAALEKSERWQPALVERADLSNGESPEIRSATLLPAAHAGGVPA